MENIEALEAARAVSIGAQAASDLKKYVGQIDHEDTGDRTFVAPIHQHSKFLINRGVVEEAPFQANNTINMRPAVQRHGDKWVKFTAGVVTTSDPEEIEWLEAHAGDPELHQLYHVNKGEVVRDCHVPVGLCREQGPGIDTWFQLKMSQVATASRDPVVDPEIDVDAFVRSGPRESLANGEGARVAGVMAANQAARKERSGGNRNS